jgi:hypothetical protein
MATAASEWILCWATETPEESFGTIPSGLIEPGLIIYGLVFCTSIALAMTHKIVRLSRGLRFCSI